MAGENQGEVSSTTFFDLPLYDVILPLITRDLSDWDLLAMWKAVAEFQAYRETIEEIIGAKRILTVSENSPDKEIFPIAVKTCRQLRGIIINFHKLRQHWNKSLVKLLANNPMIYKIFIVYGTWERLLKIFNNAQISLRHVILSNVNMRNEGLSAFFAQQPSLRSIALDNVSYNFSCSLRTIGRTCHELEEINMASCENQAISDDDMRCILHNCPKLRTFLLPESTLHLMREDDFWIFYTDILDLLLDRNIKFCDADDPLLLDLMEESNEDWNGDEV